MIDAVKKGYPIALLCDVMEVSRSGYYFWKKRGKSARQQEYEDLASVVKEAHKVTKGTYGARRIAEEVEAHGVSCGRAKAATLMKLADVAATQKKNLK
ncbi:MAG: IS3 family transposase [Desulfoarculaceae bacterium]|nr:IS3 family transposase [Desulfoarculaceae bacterium]